MSQFPFPQEDRVLLAALHVKNIIFSEGTYQVEVEDSEAGETFWPFLQISDDGELKDSFCTCEKAEKTESCPHLFAAYLEITKQGPLHIRFRLSLWNELCMMGFKRHGADVALIQKKGEKNFAIDHSLFWVEVKTERGKKALREMTFEREEETEETSLKFSNLSVEELTLWKKGTPSLQLQYELSYWSDLAKWMILTQEKGDSYSLDFSDGEDDLPQQVILNFSDLTFGFSLTEVNWPDLIPCLKSVNSPLLVHEFRGMEIEKISYDSTERTLHISSKKEEMEGKKGKIIGEWEYRPNVGFFPIEMDPLLQKKIITAPHIGKFLTTYQMMLERYLIGATLHPKPIEPKYHLFFDLDHNLHIVGYLFSKGDLQQKLSAFFPPWIFIEGKGFYQLNLREYPELEAIIPPHEMEDFITQNRIWLNNHEGFQIHISNVEFQLLYRFEEGESLSIESDSQVIEESEEMIDLGEWLYIKGKGFYHKVGRRNQISPGTVVPRAEISSFITKYREELEQVKNFFASQCPIEKVGLTISLTDEKKIVVTPEYFYRPEYRGREIPLLGNYTYVEKEGFSEIPLSGKLPPKYQTRCEITESGEPFFITVELIKLGPNIIKIDKRLKKPHALTLQVKRIKKDPRASGKKWILELIYVSELGEIPLHEVKKHLDRHHSYAITEAGLLSFKDPRFHWLRDLSAKQFSPDGETVKLTTLEWIRLRTMEKVEEFSPLMDKKSRTLLTQMDSFETSDVIDLEGLLSELRPYQEVGVKWLYFLYSFGLSGLLCDDMGLGKTHQAMGLLAAVHNSCPEKRRRYFVVCPTSVIYHWEELLQRFFPSLEVVVFYGTKRTLEAYSKGAHLLLTSYGTLRSEQKALSKIPFELAIFDEIQIAKNINSQTHKTLLKVKARSKMGLTGTPIENRLLELKALFDVILPGYFPSSTQFREQFTNPIERANDQEKKELLSRLIHPFMLRRKKSEVLEDLPEKMETIAHSVLSEEQQKLYKEAFLNTRNVLLDKLNNEKKQLPFLHIFSLLNTLKQVCNHPCLITKDFDNYDQHQSGKWDLFVELLQEARESGQKLVVFSQFLGMLTIIEKHLKKNNIGYATIRGATRNRREQIKRFQEDPTCEVFVASLKAAGTGIDLTAGSVVIHYDRWWNPAKENQATDRVHRIGQNRGVQVFKMVTKGTIEEHIHMLIGTTNQCDFNFFSHNSMYYLL